MATKQIIDTFSNSIANTVEAAFTSPDTNGVVIEAFTASNNSGINASYKAYIVTDGGDEKAQRPFKIVVWGEIDLGVGLVNQIIPAGASLKIESSAINSIYFTVTGREVS